MSLTPETTKLEELRGKLYSKAKTEPTFRFYALYDKVYRWDVLTEALRLSREKNGAPGVDGQTFDQIREYGEERWLQELQQELQEKTYRPQPVRRVLIPKPGGGERPLGIPTIKDRVAQTAAKLILEPIFEADLSDTAYGYRPGRGAVRAVQQVHQELRRRRTKVVDADLSKYFDTIPHAELMTCLARRIADAAMLHLIKMWLKVPVEERDEQGRRRFSGGKRSKCGTPQGGVVSPLLANIYINRMLKAFAKSDLMRRCGARIVNYADDFVVLCEHSAAAGPGGGEALDRWDEAETQRSQDVSTRRMEGKLPLLGIRVRTVGVSADANALPGSPTVEEGNGEGPTAGERNPLARSYGALEGHLSRAQPVPHGLGGLLRLRHRLPIVPHRGHSRRGTCEELPEKEAQAVQRDSAVRLRRGAS